MGSKCTENVLRSQLGPKRILVYLEPRERVRWHVVLPTLWEANSAVSNSLAELRSHSAAKERGEREGKEGQRREGKGQKECEKNIQMFIFFVTAVKTYMKIVIIIVVVNPGNRRGP